MTGFQFLNLIQKTSFSEFKLGNGTTQCFSYLPTSSSLHYKQISRTNDLHQNHLI